MALINQQMAWMYQQELRRQTLAAYAQQQLVAGDGSGDEHNNDSKTLIWLDNDQSNPITLNINGSLTNEIIQNAIENGEQNG